MTDAKRQAGAIAKFRARHESGCFVLPNPWDPGTAVFLQSLGAEAVTTTSAGVAFALGLPDTVTSVPRDTMLAHCAAVARAVDVPVNADFQSGYADDPEALAANVKLCIATGVAGLSIEDATGRTDAPIYDASLAVERIRAARAAIDASGVPVILTARCEAILVGQKDATRVAIDRLVAYAEAGAECLFAPGIRRPEDIAALVKAVAPKPVNVLVSAPSPALSVARLGELGVRRVSVGSTFARVAWGAFMRAAKSVMTTGTFDTFGDAASFAELNDLFDGRQ